jgi:hypothetical protein
MESNEMENQRAHKYYCIRCDRYLFGETAAFLATALNYHATAYHPTDCSTWTADQIILSKMYEGTTGPLPKYLEAHGTTSKRVPTITAEDEAMLSKAGIKWG